MTAGDGAVSFAIKMGFFALAAVAIVFVAMLVLTVLHP
jgi:hypothetical protein